MGELPPTLRLGTETWDWIDQMRIYVKKKPAVKVEAEGCSSKAKAPPPVRAPPVRAPPAPAVPAVPDPAVPAVPDPAAPAVPDPAAPAVPDPAAPAVPDPAAPAVPDPAAPAVPDPAAPAVPAQASSLKRQRTEEGPATATREDAKAIQCPILLFSFLVCDSLIIFLILSNPYIIIIIIINHDSCD